MSPERSLSPQLRRRNKLQATSEGDGITSSTHTHTCTHTHTITHTCKHEHIYLFVYIDDDTVTVRCQYHYRFPVVTDGYACPNPAISLTANSDQGSLIDQAQNVSRYVWIKCEQQVLYTDMGMENPVYS